MKKYVFIFILALTTFSTAWGQWRKGIHVGIGHSDALSKAKHSGMVSYTAGVFGEYRFGSGFVLHGELNYVNKGATLDKPEMQQWNGIINRYEFHLDYVEVPLSMGYALRLGDEFAITPRAGMYAAYGVGGYGLLTTDNLKADQDPGIMRVEPFKVTQGKMPAQNAQYFFDAFQRQNVGIVLSVDTDISKRFRLSLNSQFGLLYPLAQYSTGSVHLRNITLSIGYAF